MISQGKYISHYIYICNSGLKPTLPTIYKNKTGHYRSNRVRPSTSYIVSTINSELDVNQIDSAPSLVLTFSVDFMENHHDQVPSRVG